MSSPCGLGITESYSGAMHCILVTLQDFNSAVVFPRADEECGSCAICNDTLSSPGHLANKPPTTIMLPACKHRFHEICILQWLSPILLPRTTQEPARSTPGLDPVVRSLEARSRAVRGAQNQTSRQTDERLNPYETLESMRALIYSLALRGAIQAADRITLEEVLDEFAPIDEDDDILQEDDLEEGEIREDRPPIYDFDLDTAPASSDVGEDEDADESAPVDQELHPVNLFDGSFARTHTLSSDHPTARSACCPLCRQPAFGLPLSCHADTLQLLRVRLRLSDLAYASYGFILTEDENEVRRMIVEFLQRRHEDNRRIGECEILPTARDCKRIFRQARLTLREEALRHIQSGGTHDTAAQSAVLKLILFYENFTLEDGQINWFFDPAPSYLNAWNLEELMQDEPTLLHDDPRMFCNALRLEDESDESEDEIEMYSDEDKDMADSDMADVPT